MYAHMFHSCDRHGKALTSGAAYGGEPHQVANSSSGLKKFENPKSAILIFLFESNSKFSAWKWEKKQIEWFHYLMACDDTAVRWDRCPRPQFIFTNSPIGFHVIWFICFYLLQKNKAPVIYTEFFSIFRHDTRLIHQNTNYIRSCVTRTCTPAWKTSQKYNIIYVSTITTHFRVRTKWLKGILPYRWKLWLTNSVTIATTVYRFCAWRTNVDISLMSFKWKSIRPFVEMPI